MAVHTSPPVSRILSTPASTNMLASLNISCWLIIFDWGCKSTPSSGIQYTHLKLHLSCRRATRRGDIGPIGSVSENISWATTANPYHLQNALFAQQYASLGRHNVHRKLARSDPREGPIKRNKCPGPAVNNSFALFTGLRNKTLERNQTVVAS